MHSMCVCVRVCVCVPTLVPTALPAFFLACAAGTRCSMDDFPLPVELRAQAMGVFAQIEERVQLNFPRDMLFEAMVHPQYRGMFELLGDRIISQHVVHSLISSMPRLPVSCMATTTE